MNMVDQVGFVNGSGLAAVGDGRRGRHGCCDRRRLDAGAKDLKRPATVRTRRLGVRMSMGDELIYIMVNGMPGGMATETAEAVARRHTLVPVGLTGADTGAPSTEIMGTSVELVRPDERDQALKEVKEKYPGVVAIDFTHPTAVNGNVELYAKYGIDSIIGTTGGDEQREAVMGSPGVYSVIAPNMGKQIVAFQAMMKSISTDFPGCLSGYTMNVVESHQSTKPDTSGTAKAVINSFNDMGVDFSVDDVEKVRTEDVQLDRMGVPMKYLKGHAYHTYTLTSPDGTVTLEFKHNVRGRLVYAEGTVDAAEFLVEKRALGVDQQIFNMIDILRSGKMQ